MTEAVKVKEAVEVKDNKGEKDELSVMKEVVVLAILAEAEKGVEVIIGCPDRTAAKDEV